MKVLVIGAGAMAKEHCKVLKALDCEPVVVGRGAKKAEQFEQETGIPVLCGGIEANIEQVCELSSYAIVAVTVDCLAAVTISLLRHGIKNILVEKPAGMTCDEIKQVSDLASGTGANVYVAYNRRYYASVQKAMDMIAEDGGVSSFHFEFTEWAHVIEKIPYSQEIKENWFLENSTHVVDTAFFLGGFPTEMKSYVNGALDWHSRGSIYAGAGISEKNALFSYQANWGAPGRWAVEVLTRKHRLYLKPMEKLQVQEIGSVAVNPVEIDDALDLNYKPGLYRQAESFLKGISDGKKLTIQEHLAHTDWYCRIEGISNI